MLVGSLQNILALQVKPLFALKTYYKDVLVQVPGTPLLDQDPANAPGKLPEDGDKLNSWLLALS